MLDIEIRKTYLFKCRFDFLEKTRREYKLTIFIFSCFLEERKHECMKIECLIIAQKEAVKRVRGNEEKKSFQFLFSDMNEFTEESLMFSIN